HSKNWTMRLGSVTNSTGLNAKMLRTNPRGSHRPVGSFPCAGGMALGVLGRLYEGLFALNLAWPAGVIGGGGSLNVRKPPPRFQTPSRSLFTCAGCCPAWAYTADDNTSIARDAANNFK